MLLLAKCTAAVACVGFASWHIGSSPANPHPETEPILGHCQIPCGIYNDAARFTELAEHITTIEKSMKLIGELQAKPTENANQLIRWVMNKEQHADAITEILTKYFLQQRVKTDEADTDAKSYHAKLAAIHKMMVLSMKAKQTIDSAHTDALKKTLHDFQHLYDVEHKH